MPKTRPSNCEIKTAGELKNWFEKKPDSFCYVTGKVRQYWYIGHNNLVIFGSSATLKFHDMTGGVWLVTVKEKKNDEQKEQKEESTEGN